jgi:hypothetical protein
MIAHSLEPSNLVCLILNPFFPLPNPSLLAFWRAVKTIEPPKHVIKLGRKDLLPGLAFLLLTLFVALMLVFWSPREGRHDVLHSRMRRYNAHIASPLPGAAHGAARRLLRQNAPVDDVGTQRHVPDVWAQKHNAGPRRLLCSIP